MVWGRMAVFVRACDEQSLRLFGLEAVALGELLKMVALFMWGLVVGDTSIIEVLGV